MLLPHHACVLVRARTYMPMPALARPLPPDSDPRSREPVGKQELTLPRPSAALTLLTFHISKIGEEEKKEEEEEGEGEGERGIRERRTTTTHRKLRR